MIDSVLTLGILHGTMVFIFGVDVVVFLSPRSSCAGVAGKAIPIHLMSRSAVISQADIDENAGWR